MIHTAFFYIPVNFVFNLPHYVTSYMHHTGKKESKKGILKKEKKLGYEKSASRGFEPGPSETMRTNVRAAIHRTTFPKLTIEV